MKYGEVGEGLSLEYMEALLESDQRGSWPGVSIDQVLWSDKFQADVGR